VHFRSQRCWVDVSEAETDPALERQLACRAEAFLGVKI